MTSSESLCIFFTFKSAILALLGQPKGLNNADGALVCLNVNTRTLFRTHFSSAFMNVPLTCAERHLLAFLMLFFSFWTIVFLIFYALSKENESFQQFYKQNSMPEPYKLCLAQGHIRRVDTCLPSIL